jgi:hypothetical protein
MGVGVGIRSRSGAHSCTPDDTAAARTPSSSSIRRHNCDGQMGVHWEIYGRHIDVIKLLLEYGARVGYNGQPFSCDALDIALCEIEQTHGADST